MTAAPTAMIADECYRCGYDLRGIDNAQPCPECGLLAERSRHVSDDLHDTRPRWLRSLSVGVWLMLLAIAIAVGWSVAVPDVFEPLLGWAILSAFGRPPWYLAAMPWLGLDVAAVCFFCGVLLLTVREGYAPADAADARFRRLVRWTALAPIVALLLGQLQSTIDRVYSTSRYYYGNTMRPLEIAAALLITLGSLPLPLLVFLRLRSLAKRARSAHLAEHCLIVGTGASAAILYASAAGVLIANGDELFGGYWVTRSNVALVLMLLMGTVGLLFILWSLYLLIRFAEAFGRASSQLRRKWIVADRSSA